MNVRLRLNCSVVAMAALGALGAEPATAQAPVSNSPQVESVTVSGSRISIQGYEATTPVTVVNTVDLERSAYINIDSALVELPAVGISATLTNGVGAANLVQADAGLSTVNLRNLGVNRTLVLFDGQRIVSSNLLEGGVDLGTIPANLIQRVDIVTGGASAAYGSDAVAGVVNLILNKDFSGIKANLQFGDGTTVRHREIKAALTIGTEFDGGRGHLILSGDHTWSNDPVFISDTDWYDNGQGPDTDEAIALFLQSVGLELGDKRMTMEGGRRPWAYVFPPLQEMRDAFQKVVPTYKFKDISPDSAGSK